MYLSRGLYQRLDRRPSRHAVASGGIIPLDGLVGQFPTTADQFSLAYGESVSAVDFMIRTYGQPALVKLVRSYAGGVSDDEAFKAALGVDTAGFNSAWLKDLGVQPAPKAYGPQPAPAGPLPSDWLGAAPGASAGPVASGSRATRRPRRRPAPGRNRVMASARVRLDRRWRSLVIVVIVALVVGLVVIWRRRRRTR